MGRKVGGLKRLKKSGEEILIKTLTPATSVDRVQVYLGVSKVELWFNRNKTPEVWTDQLKAFWAWNNCPTEDP